MRIYARIDSGIVVEIIEPMTDGSGIEIPVASRFTPAFVDTLIDITSMSPQPGQYWAYDGKNFSQPSP